MAYKIGVGLGTCPRCGAPTMSREVINQPGASAQVHVASESLACDPSAATLLAGDVERPAGCSCPCGHVGGCLTCGCACEPSDPDVCPCCGADDTVEEQS